MNEMQNQLRSFLGFFSIATLFGEFKNRRSKIEANLHFHFISYILANSVTLYREITIKFTRLIILYYLGSDMTPASPVENKIKGILGMGLSGFLIHGEKRTRISDGLCHSFGPIKKCIGRETTLFQVWVYWISQNIEKRKNKKIDILCNTVGPQ